MTEQDIINAYEWFRKRTESMRRQRELIINNGITPSKYYDNVEMHNYVAFKIIEAYASKKGLINNDK